MAVKQETVFHVFLHWLPLAFVTTVLCGLIYGAVQQNYRQSANDPQIELAANLTYSLSQPGSSPEQLGVPQKQDMSKTLSPFFIVYDEKGKVTASSADLNGKTPVIPKGALDEAGKSGESHITWEPASGVRNAVVIQPYKNDTSSGYVVVGRSLREIEKREDALGKAVFGTWVLALLGSFLGMYFLHTYPVLLKKKK